MIKPVLSSLIFSGWTVRYLDWSIEDGDAVCVEKVIDIPTRNHVSLLVSSVVALALG